MLPGAVPSWRCSRSCTILSPPTTGWRLQWGLHVPQKEVWQWITHGILLWDKSFRLKNIRGENGAALERFSIFLESCTGAVSGSRYSLRFDQPGNIQKLVLKLPYNLRERWLRRANDIIELQSKPMDFSDLITFVDLEASIVIDWSAVMRWQDSPKRAWKFQFPNANRRMWMFPKRDRPAWRKWAKRSWLSRTELAVSRGTSTRY